MEMAVLINYSQQMESALLKGWKIKVLAISLHCLLCPCYSYAVGLLLVPELA